MKVFAVFIFCYVGISIGSALQSNNQHRRNDKLTLNIYYETLCGGCAQFISKQLCPAWETMNNYFKVDFVPYGNAKTNVSETGEITITCQHGEDECEGNRIQSCALKHLSYIQSTKFLCCYESSDDFGNAGPDCASKLGIDYNPIEKCADGPEGAKLHYLNGIKTSKLKPKHKWVPWILYNGVYNAEDMKRSMEDFIPVLCKHFEDPKPRECNEIID